jgi:3-(3-hydroxy-phenyl)propionate hydroxylase
MIDLSTAFGRVIKPTNPLVAGARDAASAVLNLFPHVKDYFAQMKYKPMPRYTSGVVVDASSLTAGRSSGRLSRSISAFASANTDVSPVGTQFIQPVVETTDGRSVKLDEAAGDWWSVIMWGSAPEQMFDAADLDTLRRLGARVVCIRPMSQLGNARSTTANTVTVGDATGKLKLWFDERPTPVLILRPDRFIAAACLVQDAGVTLAAVASAAHLLPAGAPSPTGTDANAAATNKKENVDV